MTTIICFKIQQTSEMELALSNKVTIDMNMSGTRTMRG